MIRWLQDNPVGMALAVLCGGLLAVMLGLGVWSLVPAGPGYDPEAGEAGDELPPLPELKESPPIDAFRVVTERPLFSETRQPPLEGEEPGDIADDFPPEEVVDAPDVELAGVVITPSLRMVTLRKKDKQQSLVAFEGRPIEDEDFGSWQVSRIGSRDVVLTSGRGEELLLELRVHDEKIAPPERPAPAQEAEPEAEVEAQPEVAPTEDDTRMSRAEEIRQRIAERREELRRQAEAEEQGGDQAAAPDYQQAIRSMIGRSRRNDGDNQDEQ